MNSNHNFHPCDDDLYFSRMFDTYLLADSDVSISGIGSDELSLDTGE